MEIGLIIQTIQQLFILSYVAAINLLVVSILLFVYGIIFVYYYVIPVRSRWYR